MKKILMFLVILLVSFTAVSCGESKVDVKGITISSAENVRNVNIGQTLQLSAVVYPEGASQEVVWSSKDSAVATVSESGLVTGVSIGTTSIVATSKENDSIKSEFALIVLQGVVNPETITLTAANGQTSCYAGEKIQLTAQVMPQGADQSVNWTTSDQSIATVKSGLVSTLAAGTVTITATSRVDATVTSSITLTINAANAPVVSSEWAQMAFTTHEDYINKENDEKLKVKGVVTYVGPVSEDNTVSYFIQSGNDGYYVYAQDNIKYPVVLGKSYEVGGYKKYYKGLNEIVNIEHFVETENLSYNVIDLTGKNPADKEAMKVYQGAYVSGEATLVSVTVNTSKAFNVVANVNGNETTLRVDPAYAGEDEFGKICKLLSTAVAGVEFEFKGFMTAYGNYAAAVANQIQIVKASDLVMAEASVEEVLAACKDQLSVISSVAMNTNTISLPTSVAGFEDVTLTWSSNSNSINVTTGVVTHSQTNEVVTLTATLTKEGVTVTKDFKVTVFAKDDKVYQVLVSLDLEDSSSEGSWGCSATKPGYAEGVVKLGTPNCNWLLRNALIAFSSDDKTEGTFAIRAKAGSDAAGTARIEIQEAGEYNIVEFAGAAYGNHVLTSQVRIEYTFDDGQTWLVSDVVVTLSSPTLETYRVYLPEGVKRVAIVVVENSGKTVNIDSIKLMK